MDKLHKMKRFFSKSIQKFSQKLRELFWSGNSVTYYAIRFEEFIMCETYFDLCGYPLCDTVNRFHKAKKFHFYAAIVCMFLSSVHLFFSALVFWRNQNYQYLVECVAHFGVLFITIIKVLTFVKYYRPPILEIIEQLRTYFPQRYSEQRTFGIRRNLTELNTIFRLACYMYGGVFVHACSFMFQLQIYGWITSQGIEMKDVFVAWYPFDTSGSFLFWTIYISEVWINGMACSIIFGTDILYAGIIAIVTMEFEVLGEEISVAEDVEELRELVKRHQMLIKISGKLEEIFAPLLLINIFASIVITCLTAFLTVVGVSSDMAYKYFIVVICALYEVFIMCYYAQRLTDASSSISFAAYNSPWYDSNLKFRKLILIIMINAQEGIQLTAWSFFSVSMETYYWILQTSHSYYSVLMGLYEA